MFINQIQMKNYKNNLLILCKMSLEKKDIVKISNDKPCRGPFSIVIAYIQKVMTRLGWKLTFFFVKYIYDIN